MSNIKIQKRRKKNNIDKILIYSNRKFITINKENNKICYWQKELLPKEKL